MNDAAVREIWKALDALDKRVQLLAEWMDRIDARIRARLKEEADGRQGLI